MKMVCSPLIANYGDLYSCLKPVLECCKSILVYKSRMEVSFRISYGLMATVLKYIVFPARGGSSKTSIRACTTSMVEVLGRLNENYGISSKVSYSISYNRPVFLRISAPNSRFRGDYWGHVCTGMKSGILARALSLRPTI